MFPLPLVVAPRTSSRLRQVLTGAGILAAFALFLAELPALARYTGLIALIAGLWINLRGQPAQQYRCTAEGRLEIWSENAWQVVTLLSARSHTLPWLLLLRYRRDGARWADTAIFTADNLSADDFRRLAVWARWKPRPGKREKNR